MDKWDRALQYAQEDTWWMPDWVTRVDGPEIAYTYDPRGSANYSLVVRVDPALKDYGPLIEEVMAHHRASGDSTFLIGPASSSVLLMDALHGYGYRSKGASDNWTIDVDAERPPIPEQIEVKRVIDEQGMRDMDAVMKANFTSWESTDDAKLRRDLQACIGPTARCRRYVAYDRATGLAVSTGALNIFSTLGLGFMWGGSTIKGFRGQGVYSALLTARMRDAKNSGLARLGVHAMRATSGPIIEKQGFEKHGRVDYMDKTFDLEKVH